MLLTLLGVVAYFVSETRSVTALIPAFVGVPLILLGAITAAKPDLRKHTMHAAAALGVLGFLASAGRFAMKPAAPTSIGPASLLIMAVLCGLFVVLCVRSFIAARKARTQGFEVQSTR